MEATYIVFSQFYNLYIYHRILTMNVSINRKYRRIRIIISTNKRTSKWHPDVVSVYLDGATRSLTPLHPRKQRTVIRGNKVRKKVFPVDIPYFQWGKIVGTLLTYY